MQYAESNVDRVYSYIRKSIVRAKKNDCYFILDARFLIYFDKVVY